MDLDQANNRLDRRRAFRIYEQVDLFYLKIEYDQESEAKLDLNNVINKQIQPQTTNNPPSLTSSSSNQLLPESQSRDNDTLNVNISSSGISFTCREELRPGDYMVIRVLLLSSMKLIMTCCKVVYCKPGNPYEKKRYPYLVGVHFVNVRFEDKELLNKHIKKKNTQLLFLNGLAVSLVITILAMPHLAFDLLLDSCSFLLDTIFEFTHFIYLLIEYSLEHSFEYFFHTEVRETQFICFYILFALKLAAIYPLVRFISSAYKYLFNCYCVFYYRKKKSFLFYWKEQTLLYRVTSISIGIIAILCYVSFFI